jgi:hypothetical protein
MQQSNPLFSAAIPAADAHRLASLADLQRLSRGEVTLGAALQMLAHHQEEQRSADADLCEREAWVVSSILARSEAAWDLLAKPTIRFSVSQSGDFPPYHLEVGRYVHLTALTDLSPGEQALVASSAPCWARVYPHRARQESGWTGALARSYVPITTAEAVAKLGMGTIVSAIEGAVRSAGSDLRAQAELQGRRQDRVAEMERALGWDDGPQDAPEGRMALARTWLVLLLLGHGGRTGRVLGTMLVGISVILLCLLFGPVLLFIALPPTIAGLLAWQHLRPV